MDVDASSPEIAARNSLLQLIDIIKGDSGPLVSQLKHDPSYDLDKDWEDIKQKINNREYTIYSTLGLDLQKILDSVLSASKKNIKQQRPYSLSHKNIKKQLDQYERFMRARLYEWHPGGKQAAAQEEETYRVEQWNSLAHVRTAELHAQSAAQLRNALTVQQRSKDANINESIARILETSQNVTSTHAFGEDPLAVHTWLGQGLPWVSEFQADDLLDSDGEHPAGPAIRGMVDEGATAMSLSDGKMIPRQDVKEVAATKPPADVARGDAAAHAGGAVEDGGNSCLRATQWKCSWLELRIGDLSYLERELTSMIAAKEARVVHELAAAEDSPYLAGKSPRRPLQPLPASASDPATCGFSEEALRGHPFFKECCAAVESETADAVVPVAEGTVQDMSDDETAPAAVYWAFASIEDNVHAFLNYIASEQGGGAVPATATAAPSKVPKKAPPRARGHAHVQVPLPPVLGRRGSERKPHQRRESSLPEEVRTEITRKLEKPYVPPTRVLTSEDIAARIEDESSGEDDTSDAYYLRLHDAELAKKDEAEKAGTGDVQHKAHRRHHPATSAPLPASAGRGRAAGKGPVNAVSASSGGQLATSATPSGAASHTHAGLLSSVARAPHDARSTLPALVGPNSSSAAAAPAGALATTAIVGAAGSSGTADRRQQQPVPSFVVAAPHRFNKTPSNPAAPPGTAAAARPAAPPAQQNAPAAPSAVAAPPVPAIKPPTATGTAAAAVPAVPANSSPAASAAPAAVPASEAGAAATAAPGARPAAAPPTVPATRPPPTSTAAPTAPAVRPAAVVPSVGAVPTVPAIRPGADVPTVPAPRPVAAASSPAPPAKQASAVPGIPAARPAAAAGAPGAAATGPAVGNTHGVVRSVPRATAPASVPTVPASSHARKPGAAQPAASTARPAPIVGPPAAQAVRPGAAPAQPHSQRAAAAPHRPRPAPVSAATASPAARHMHAGVAAAAAAVHKAAAPGAGAAARPAAPGAAKLGSGGVAKHAHAPPAAVPLSRPAPQAGAGAPPAPAHGVVHNPGSTMAEEAPPGAAPAAGGARAGSGQGGAPRGVPEGGAPARRPALDQEGLRPKRTATELHPAEASMPQAPARAVGMATSPRKKKVRSK